MKDNQFSDNQLACLSECRFSNREDVLLLKNKELSKVKLFLKGLLSSYFMKFCDHSKKFGLLLWMLGS